MMRRPVQVTVSTIVILIHAALPSSSQVRPEVEASGSALVHGLVSGQILDAVTGFVLEGAQVTLRALPEGMVGLLRVRDSADPGSSFPRLTRNAVTADDGVYRFEGLPDGRFELRVRRLGYRPATLVVDLRDGAGLNMSVGLTVIPIRLEPIEAATAPSPTMQRVRAQLSRPDSARPAAVRNRQLSVLEPDARVLTTADLMESVSLGYPDLFRALQGLAGVHSPTSGTAEFWVRGAPFEHTSVRWDGLPIYNAFAGRGEVAAVTSDAIGGVFLYSGNRPASVAGGGAALLDLRTRRASGTGDVRGVGEATGSWGRLGMEQRTADGRMGWLVAGRRQLITRHGVTDLTVRFDVALDEERSIDVGGISLWEYSNSPVCCGTWDTAIWRNRAGRISLTATWGGFRGTHFVGGSQFLFFVEPVVPDSNFRTPSEIVSQPATDVGLRYITFGSKFTQKPSASSGHPWRFGYELVNEAVGYTGPIPTTSTLTGTVRVMSSARSIQYGTVWANKRVSVHERVSLEIGARADVGPAPHGQSVIRFAPRLATRFGVTSNLSFSVSAGRNYRYAHGVGETGVVLGTSVGGRRRLTRVWLLAGDQLPAARTDIAAVGVEAWVRGDWLASFSAFARSTSGVAVSDPRSDSSDERRPFVLGSDRAHGFEATVRRLAGRWTTSLAYSYAVARREADGLDYRSPADVRHVLDANIAWRMSRPFRIGAAFVAATGAPFTQVQVCNQFAASCPDHWNDIGSPNALRLPSDGRLSFFGEWTKRNASWDLSVFVRWSDVLGDNRDDAYLGTVPGCPVRLTTPCNGQSSTDVVLSVYGGQRFIGGFRVAF